MITGKTNVSGLLFELRGSKNILRMGSYIILNETTCNPLVSIAMLAYNHENYIREAIESVLQQKTFFNYKIIIAEDFSNDETRKIVLEYQQKHPDIIKLILQNKNVGASQNNIDLLSNLEGEFIAALEADDYWTDPLKLQKQVDFLEANPDYGLVHTNYNLIISGIVQPNQNRHKVVSGHVFNELINHDFFIATLTVLARRSLINDGLAILKNESIKRNWKMGDYPMWIEGSLKTKFGYLPDTTACYRIHDGSASNKKDSESKLAFLRSVWDIKNYFIIREKVSEKIKNKAEADHLRKLLALGFETKNVRVSEDAYSKLKTISDNKLYNRMMLFGSKNNFNRIITKIYRKLFSNVVDRK
jgi:glycosyltransferase involved in cell wall biosynthesis